MKKQDEELLFKIALAAAAYVVVVKPLLKTIGLDPADTNLVDSTQTQASPGNPFSPLFIPAVQWVTAKSGGQSPSTYYANMKSAYEQSASTGLQTTFEFVMPLYSWLLPSFTTPTGLTGDYYNDVPILAEAVKGSMGAWVENTDRIKWVFSQVTSQIEVSMIAAYLSYNYGKDLLTYIRDGFLSFSWLKGGIGDANIAAIIQHVNTLPVQPPQQYLNS